MWGGESGSIGKYIQEVLVHTLKGLHELVGQPYLGHPMN